MDSLLSEDATASAHEAPPAPSWDQLYQGEVGTGPGEEELHAAFRDELDRPGLVLSPDYIGPDRRAPGLRARLARATFRQRRSVFSLEFAVLGIAVVAVLASLLLVDPGAGRSGTASASAARSDARVATTPRAATTAPAPTTTAPAPTTTAPPPTTTAPAPTTTAPTAAAAPSAPAAAVTPATVPVTPAPAPAALTPSQLGSQALALVRYPWQSIPGYSIQFLPISDAPSAGFYGNTTFTWGQPGGTSILYVYPGETVERLAGITAFEIAA